jgi:hypothetical protein
MRLTEVLARLAKHGLGKVGTWKFQGRHGITLGDPTKYFPHPTGPQYPIDTTDNEDPEMIDEEVKAIERRFGRKL